MAAVRATPDDLTEATQRAQELLEDSVAPLADAYDSVYRAAGRRMARGFKTHAVSLTADAGFVPPDEDEVVGSERLAEEMTEAAREAQEQAAVDVGSALHSTGIAFDVEQVFTPELIDGIGERATFAADEDLRGAYRSVIEEAAEEGWSITRTSDAIVEKVDGIADYRATALARTDLVGLANGGSVHVAQQTGAIYKRWLATDDDATRDTHVEADGQTVPVHESFHVGGAALPYPGFPFGPAEEVMNCRCTITYSDSPADGERQTEPDPLEGVKPTSEGLRWQVENWEKEEARRGAPDLRAEVDAKLKTELAGYPIHIRVPTDIAGQKVIPEGRFKSQFESARSGGLLDYEFRTQVERDLFSYPRDLPPAERPIYGYVGRLTSEEGMVAQYGDAVFVLKDSVRARTTFSQIDSLGTGIVPSPIENPSHLSVSVDDFQLTEPLERWSAHERGEGYWEAQIHGGVTLDDVKAIRLWYRGEIDYPYIEADADVIEQALLDQGRTDIRVELRQYGDDELRGSAESGLGVLEDLLDIHGGGDLAPVAASSSGGRRDLVADRPKARVVDAGESIAEVVFVPSREQEERELASDRQDLHVPDYRAVEVIDFRIDEAKLAQLVAESLSETPSQGPRPDPSTAPWEELARAYTGALAHLALESQRDREMFLAALEEVRKGQFAEAPVVNVTVPEPVVNVTVPAPEITVQPAPVEVSVSPTPVEVNVEVPPSPARTVRFERDPVTRELREATIEEADE